MAGQLAGAVAAGAAGAAAGACANAEALASMVSEETRHNWASDLDMIWGAEKSKKIILSQSRQTCLISQKNRSVRTIDND